MSEASQLSDLYPHMIPELPDCPAPLLLQALQQAARTFCERSQTWVETLASVDLEDGVLEYSLSPDWDARIQTVEEVRINSEAGVDAGDKGAVQDMSLIAWDPDEQVLTLDASMEPADDVTDGLEVDVCLVPLLDTTEVPEWLLNRYAEGITGYAMWYLLKMPSKRWSNPDLAQVYWAQYRGQLTRAKAERQRKYRAGNVGVTA